MLARGVPILLVESDFLTMTRPSWETPPDSELIEGIKQWDEDTRAERASRYSIFLSEFGPPADMLLFGGLPALLAIHELQRTFISGNYLATILLAQVFVEHSLAGSYRMAGRDDIVEAGLGTLIDQALNDEGLSPEVAGRLHDLRTMRNPYTHPHAGAPPRSYMARLRDRGPEPFAMAEADAMEAVQIVVDYLRHGSPDWGPPRG